MGANLIYGMLLCAVGETVAEGDTLSGHWWIMLLAALVVMLAIAVIIFIICFVTHTRRRKQLPTGNSLIPKLTDVNQCVSYQENCYYCGYFVYFGVNSKK